MLDMLTDPWDAASRWQAKLYVMAGSDFRAGRRERLAGHSGATVQDFHLLPRPMSENIVWALTDPCQPSTETQWLLDFKLGRFHHKKVFLRDKNATIACLPARTPFAPRTVNERGIHDLRRRCCQRHPMPENKLLKSLS
jgi:hypothetical protein